MAGVAAWASVADNKTGWTVVAAAAAAVIGAFGPTVMEWRSAWLAREREIRSFSADAAREDLPESVAWLLHPSKEIVPFVGREDEVAELRQWLMKSDEPVRLLVGPGGVGKSRLAQQLWNTTRRETRWHRQVSSWVRRDRWEYRPIRYGAELAVAAKLRNDPTAAEVLLVVDYAETREPHGLATLICAAHAVRHAKLLLIARQAGRWWHDLSASYPEQEHLVDAVTGGATSRSVPPDVTALGMQRLRAIAAQAFATHLSRPVPWKALANLPDRPWGTPIVVLHAEALLVVLGSTSPGDSMQILYELILHEQRYWRGCARRAGLLDDAGSEVLDQLRDLVGLASLLGFEGNASDENLFHLALGPSADKTKIPKLARWLADLYPGEHKGRRSVIQPGLIAEILAVQAITRRSSDARATLLASLSEAQAVHALTTLGRACDHHQDARGALLEAISIDSLPMESALKRVLPALPDSGVAAIMSDWSSNVLPYSGYDIDDEPTVELPLSLGAPSRNRAPHPRAEYHWDDSSPTISTNLLDHDRRDRYD